MIKPIEAGCLALMRPNHLEIQGNTPAHVVLVLERKHLDDAICLDCRSESNFWRVDSETLCRISIVCGCDLTRIDGGDPDAITETEKELDKCV